MRIHYLGHSAFEIITNESKILIDPFLIFTPHFNPENINDIFVTHGHNDHLGSAIEISSRYHVPITAIFELANYCSKNGAVTNGIGLGAWNKYSWGKAIAVPAFHSSSTADGMYAGSPCGFIFKIDGKNIYHAGDTSLNSEMKMIGEIYKPDIAMLPIGGTYTMDIEHALIAAEWLQTPCIIPMHYNSFDAISVDIEIFKTGIQQLGKTPMIINADGYIDIKD